MMCHTIFTHSFRCIYKNEYFIKWIAAVLQDLFLSLFIFRSNCKPFYYTTLKFLKTCKSIKSYKNNLQYSICIAERLPQKWALSFFFMHFMFHTDSKFKWWQTSINNYASSYSNHLFFSANAAPDEHQTAHWGQAAFTEHFRRVY